MKLSVDHSSVPFFFPLWVCPVTKRVYSLLIDVAHLPATPLQETPCVGRQSVMGGGSVCVMCEMCVMCGCVGCVDVCLCVMCTCEW